MAKEKLTDAQRAEIAARLKADPKINKTELAKEYGVDRSVVSKMASGTYALAGQPPAAAPAAAAGAAQLLMVAAAQIMPSPLNPRRTIDAKSIDEMADSILADVGAGGTGVMQPILLRPAKKPDHGVPYELVAGERRWRAVSLLVKQGKLPTDFAIMATVRDIDDRRLIELALIENGQREDVPPIEEAKALQKLVKMGSATKEIAEAIGRTQRHVQLRLALVDKLSKTAQKALEAGDITLAQARVLTVAKKTEQDDVVDNIRNGWWSNFTAEELRAHLVDDKPNVSVALFPREVYTGEMIPAAPEDGDDEERFADVAQFEKLQRAAIEEKLAQLRDDEKAGKIAFLKVVDNTKNGVWFNSYEWQKAKAKKRAGTVVHIRRNLTLEILEGMEPRASAAASSHPTNPTAKGRAAKPAEAGPPVIKAHYIRAANAKTRALQAAIAGTRDAGPRLAVLALLLADGFTLQATARGRDDQKLDGPPLPDWMKALPMKRPASHWEHLKPKGARMLFEKLLELDDAKVAEILAALVAGHFGSWVGYSPSLGDSELVATVAEATRADMAAEAQAFLRDADALKTCRKPALIEILNEGGILTWGHQKGKSIMSCVFLDGKDATTLTQGKLREAIVKAARAGRLDGYIPRAFRFGTEKELEKATWEAPPTADGANGVRAPETAPVRDGSNPDDIAAVNRQLHGKDDTTPACFEARDLHGYLAGGHSGPEKFAAQLREHLAACTSPAEVTALHRANKATMSRPDFPADLQGQLATEFEARKEALVAAAKGKGKSAAVDDELEIPKFLQRTDAPEKRDRETNG